MFLLISVTGLDFAFQLLAVAVDLCNVVVCQFPSLLFDLALKLLPIAFNAVPVHVR